MVSLILAFLAVFVIASIRYLLVKFMENQPSWLKLYVVTGYFFAVFAAPMYVIFSIAQKLHWSGLSMATVSFLVSMGLTLVFVNILPQRRF